MRNLFFTAVLLLPTCLQVQAAPMPPLGPVDIEGEVYMAIWRDEVLIKRFTSGLGYTREYPAHYVLILTNVTGASEETLSQISVYAKMGYFPDMEMVGDYHPSDCVFLWLPSKNRLGIEPLMRVRITGYAIPLADESGILSVEFEDAVFESEQSKVLVRGPNNKGGIGA